MAIWPLGLFARLRVPKAPIVISAHGTDVSYSRRGGLKGRLYGLYQRIGSWVFRSASIIANSKATAAACRELGWRNVEVVPLATDLHPPKSCNPDHQSILFAGRIIKQKGLSWFVNQVIDQLPPQFHLRVAGSVWDKTEASALDHPKVEFLGAKSQHELAKLYADALCIVLPNLELPNGEFEGFGLVACEGASAGGVVLAAKTGGLSDAVVDGQTGFLLESGNPEAWKNKIVEIYQWSIDDRAGFVRNSQKVAETHYSWKRVHDATVQEYLRALERKSA
jgi:glycosyltransferase involved in cell wall biosynthesis